MENRNKCKGTGKTRYPDPGSAKEAMLKIKSAGRYYDYIQNKRRNRRSGKPDQCRYYYCKICQGWHLTSSEKGKSARKFIKEKKLKSKPLLLDESQATEWKKDSLPFPNINISNT